MLKRNQRQQHCKQHSQPSDTTASSSCCLSHMDVCTSQPSPDGPINTASSQRTTCCIHAGEARDGKGGRGQVHPPSVPREAIRG